MVRSLRLLPLLLALLPGCGRQEGRYTHVSVSVTDDGEVNVVMRGRAHGDSRHPCASTSRVALVNGIEMKQTSFGGGDPVPDSDREQCVEQSYRLEAGRLPANVQTLDISFESEQAQYRSGDSRGSAWHIRASSGTARVWSEDDLAARMHASEQFEVHWEPASAAPPRLHLDVFERGHWHTAKASAEVVRSNGPGSARARFYGDEPGTLWNLTALTGAFLIEECSFEDCEVSGRGRSTLQPGGIAPITPEGVVPLRECIAAPGADDSHYAAPFVFSFPDLSSLQVARRDTCEGADLYFVLLGACGVCGGGKSSFVVGNRGTRAASFSVRSNQETVDGDMLEPQQMSEPFEIAFEGGLSQLEILSDADCDTVSNTAWVSSVECLQSESQLRYKGEDCNNFCVP